ncbi:MAG: hypothetical protein KGZ79_01895 [Dethiobacter sp.]|jgi:hypothetical protein|nr:hypothetical protein [Dethiobacter sp.]
MPNDIYRDDWDEEGGFDEIESNTVGRERHYKKDSLSTIKDYVIIALIAVIVFIGYNNYIFARTGGNGAFGGGGCGGCGSGGGGAAVSTEEMRLIGLQYYAGTYGDSDVEATVEDFGCHQEIYIFKDGVRVARIGYANGEVYEL